jgi:hypothetical protein
VYYFIYVLWFVFPFVINESHQHWIIFKTFKKKILSNLSSKESEPLFNSAYYPFLALLTY